jgi:endonuclease III
VIKKVKSKNSLQVQSILKKIVKLYPEAHCELLFNNPFELLVATVLSAQCTDVAVNKVTPKLFASYPDAKSMAQAEVSAIQEKIKSVNFAPTKARNLSLLSKALQEKHQGIVPQNIEELIEFAGVGRKTANVVLGNAFGITSGIVVDTHVGRLSRRFGWTKKENAVLIEADLKKIIPKNRWIQISHELIFHGRKVCKARGPNCDECGLVEDCRQIGV